jgi:hypothetical protein
LVEVMASGREAEVAAWMWSQPAPPVAELAGWLAARDLRDPTWALLGDLVRADLDPERRRLAVAVAAALAAERLGRVVPASLAPVALELEPQALADACRRPGDAGVVAVAAARWADLRAAAGEALSAHLGQLAQLVATPPEHLPLTRSISAAVAALGAQPDAWVAAEDPDKARFFQEPKFRPHLLDGDPWQAAGKAFAFGIPRGLLAGSLQLAAAERVLRYDADSHGDAGWADVLHLLVLTSAVRGLEPLVPGGDWLRLWLFAAKWVREAAVTDRPASARVGLPEPEAVHQTWDHGPEIAKIVAQLQAGRGDRAVALARAYFLLALPDQPLGRTLIESALADLQAPAWAQALAASTMVAAVTASQGLGAHPHRELPLCAALHGLAAWRARRTTWRVLEQRVLVG